MGGADIFLSYNREDAARAKHFADGFAAEGLNVWWDVDLRSGEAYDKVTEDALRNARAVVVLWSPRSVESRWVRAEATLAERKKTLMPAMIEPCERPIMFELVQTAELSHWQGDAGDSAWKSFAAHVREFIGKEVVAPAPSKAAETLPGLDQLSVAVLPFTNMGKDEEQEYFADGITEDVITDLGKVSALSVIARNTAFTFKDQLVDVCEVARKLNVTHVLEGSVRRAGNRVRVNVQLIDGSSGSQVWSERWDRDLDDIFELQDELSQAIVEALKIKLLPKEKKAIGERATTSIEAYDLYMRAKSAANSALGPEGLAEALKLYKQVLEIDPRFSPALTGIAATSSMYVTFAPAMREELLSDLDTLYDAVAAHLPENPGVQTLHAVRLFMKLEKDWLGTFAAFERAMASAPSFDTDVTCFYSMQLGHVGRVSEAIELLEAARRIDPLSTLVRVNLQMFYLYACRFEDARAEYQRINDVAGSREDIEHYELFRVWLEGDSDATKAQYRRFLRTQTLAVSELKECLEVFDQPEAALGILRKGLENPQNFNGTHMILLACHAGLIGDSDLALAALRRSLIDFGFHLNTMIWAPYFRETRQLPGFKQFIRELGIHDYWRESGNWGDFARPVGDDDFEIIA